MKRLREWLEKREGALLHMKQRLQLLRDLERQFEQHSKDGQIMVKNHTAWRMVFDVYEMMIIDLASFYAGLLNGSNGLEQLKNYLPVLRAPKNGPSRDDFVGTASQRNERDDDTYDLACIDYNAQVGCFERLFPGRPAKKGATHDDVDELKKRLRKLAKRVKRARDKFHAHRYEEWQLSFRGLVSLADVGEWFELAEDALNCVRGIIGKGKLAYPDADQSTGFDTAQDVTELILHGSITLLHEKVGCRSAGAEPYFWQRREAFYAGADWRSEQDGWDFAGGPGEDGDLSREAGLK